VVAPDFLVECPSDCHGTSMNSVTRSRCDSSRKGRVANVASYQDCWCLGVAKPSLLPADLSAAVDTSAASHHSHEGVAKVSDALTHRWHSDDQRCSQLSCELLSHRHSPADPPEDNHHFGYHPLWPSLGSALRLVRPMASYNTETPGDRFKI
jgi:hypothetical protein